MAFMKGKATFKLLAVLFTILLILLAACNHNTNPPASSLSKTTNITILHTNDIHSHLDNMPRLSTAITRIRKGSGKDNTLLLDAGDVFSGSIYFNLYHGQALLWFMNYLGYEAMCLGNHEFDAGLETLTEFVNGAKFHIVSANIQFPTGSRLDNTIAPFVIIEKNGERYGIFGLTTEETTEISNTGIDITVTDHIAAARLAVAELERNRINKIIALTHIGWNEDLKLAREVGDIDIIIGGHTHTVPESYPAVIDEDGSPTLIAQAGENAKYLGHLSVTFDEAGVIKDWTGSEIVRLDETVAEDATCAAKLAEYRAPVEKTMATVIGKTLADLDGERTHVRSQETNLGDLITDSMLYKAGRTGAGIAILNGGSIRASVPAGDVTLGQVMSVLPFDNYLVSFELTGEQIVAALENGVSQVEEEQGRFPQVAGLRFVWDPGASPGSRIISVDVKKAGGYEPIDLNATYTVVTNNYLYQGGDGYVMFAQGIHFINLGYTDYEVLAEYITANSPVNPGIEGRIRPK
jgi:2',3'-cyclic-nucleotide 2'-phosphodiesterase (5'-nucleotidase family)